MSKLRLGLTHIDVKSGGLIQVLEYWIDERIHGRLCRMASSTDECAIMNLMSRLIQRKWQHLLRMHGRTAAARSWTSYIIKAQAHHPSATGHSSLNPYQRFLVSQTLLAGILALAAGRKSIVADYSASATSITSFGHDLSTRSTTIFESTPSQMMASNCTPCYLLFCFLVSLGQEARFNHPAV